MAKVEELKRQESVERHLQEVQALLGKHRLIENLVQKQEMPRHELVESLVHKQNQAELQRKLEALHPADVAYILEALPQAERRLVWDLVKADRDGDILLEVSDAVRETLLADMDTEEILAATEHLDTDEIADLAPDLPQDVVQDILESLDAQNRARLQSVLSYPEESVGTLMDFDMVSIREDITLEVALRYYQAAASVDLNDVQARLKLANTYHSLGKFCEAKEALESARDLETDPVRRNIILELITKFEPRCRKQIQRLDSGG